MTPNPVTASERSGARGRGTACRALQLGEGFPSLMLKPMCWPGGGERGGAGNEREFEDRAGGGVRVRKVRGMALG